MSYSPWGCKELDETTGLTHTYVHRFTKVYLDFVPGSSEVKVSACNVGDLGSIPGSGRSPGEGMATHSSTLAWEIPWTEEPGRLQSMR